MLRILNLEEIEGLLVQLPDLIRAQERQSTDFPRRVSAWLASLEDAFVANRLYQAGAVAGVRAGLLAAEQGQVPAGIEFRGRPTRSRVLTAVAAQAIDRAAAVASSLIAENRPRLVEAERVAQQIVAAARSRGLIPVRDPAATTTDFLRAFRRSLSTSDDLEGATVALVGLVGPHDAMVLLDRALAADLDLVFPTDKGGPAT